MFVTIGLSPRRALFGNVDHDHVVFSDEGEIAVQCIREAWLHYAAALQLNSFVVMPDHLHLRLSWSAQGNALRTVGAFVGRIKQTIHYRIAGHAPSIWEDSPGERMLWNALATHESAPMVRLIPTFMDLAYRPHGHEAPLFAARRLLVLSRMADPEADPTRAELLDLNEIAARLALANPGGKAVYVKWDGFAVRYESRRASV